MFKSIIGITFSIKDDGISFKKLQEKKNNINYVLLCKVGWYLL